MERERVEAVTDWEAEPFSGGIEGLRRLADRGVSGAVTDGHAWLFLLNGTPVAVFDGDLDSFAGADGTLHLAPDPALPLLYAMQETGGETRAKYYTEDTPLREVHETLSSKGFTGYIELSENVLSGDYYVVYHGGKSMSVARVGSSERLVTGEEAFEMAADEVGIYEVHPVDVDPLELPEPAADPDDEGETGDRDDEAPEPSAAVEATDGQSASAGSTAVDAEDTPVADPEDAGDETAGPEDGSVADGMNGPRPAEGAEGSSAATGQAEGHRPRSEPTDESGPETDEPPGSEGATAEADADTEATTEGVEPAGGGTDTSTGATTPDAPNDGGRETPTEGTGTPESEVDSPVEPTTAEHDGGTATEPGAGEHGDGDSPAGVDAGPDVDGERRWQEVRTIPPLDPGDEPDDGEAETEPERVASSRPRGGAEQAGDRTSGPRVRKGGKSDRVEQLEAEVDALREERDRLAEERDRLEAARSEAAAEREEYRERAERLEQTVSELRSEVERLENELAEADEGATGGRSIPPEQAISGTNLFVRYGSKGDGTLQKAVAGQADRAEVNENLKLVYHTDFEAEGLAVDGERFPAFLESTTEFRFTRWIVQDLLYEIRDTGSTERLRDLYEAIPEIDRAEFDGEVALEGDGEPSARRFDVVLRDHMGDPLLVANLNDSRQPTTAGMVENLIRDASDVADATGTVAGAFVVTASYFEPEALEATSEATESGLLRREKRASFVRLSRKQGFHFCLVESRNGEFHVNVPEL